jgi:Domain of unknown function (DUF5063)
VSASDIPLRLFAALARDFCAWCEDGADVERSAVDAAKWLARLHAHALDLGNIVVNFEGDWPELPDEDLACVRRNLTAFMGYYYRVVFDPDPTIDDAPVIGDVGDDLLDTYSDVKRGLMVYGADGNDEACWYWSYMHRIHWGQHVVGALTALNGAARKTED